MSQTCQTCQAYKTFPATLEPDEKKSNWGYDDCFHGLPLEYVHVFVHHDYSMKMHTHSFYEVNLVLRGSGRHYLEGQSFPVERGCVFVIPPDIRHGYLACPPEEDREGRTLDVCHFLVHSAFFHKYAEELRSMTGFPALFEIEPYLRSRYEEEMFLVLHEQQMAQLQPSLSQLLKLCRQEYPVGREALKNALTLYLFGLLCGYMAEDSSFVPDRQEDRARAILRCLEYIQRNCGEPLTVEKLARQCGMSRSTFIRAFEQVCHQPPIAYLIDTRLGRARELLLSNRRLTVTEIAQSCGFYDDSHFVRFFVKREGMTPSQFRREFGAAGAQD